MTAARRVLVLSSCIAVLLPAVQNLDGPQGGGKRNDPMSPFLAFWHISR